jgi:hypothetical protein
VEEESLKMAEDHLEAGGADTTIAAFTTSPLDLSWVVQLLKHFLHLTNLG